MTVIAVQTDEITARQVDRDYSENFLKFLKHLDPKYRNVQIHIIMNNLATHKNKQVTEWLAKKSMFTLSQPMRHGSISSRFGLVL